MLQTLGGGAAALLAPHTLQAAPGSAGRSPVVVELFTSQGCSSCPPADAFLHELSKQDGILALSLPVDYWDYLGWQDTFASSANTRRQKKYAENMDLRNVYTPQMVIGGTAEAAGSHESEVRAAIEKARAGTPQVPITFHHEGGDGHIRIGAHPAGARVRATVWMVYFDPFEEVPVKRGENRGRTLGYTNIVHERAPIDIWTGGPLDIGLTMKSLSEPGYAGCAVLLQKDDQGPILGAARLNI